MSDDTTRLTKRIREVLAETSESDPKALAELVLKGSRSMDRRAWLDEALPHFIADVMRSDRNQAANAAFRPPRRMPTRSSKVAGIRDWWAEFLASRIAVGETWKPVGDLTAADLASVAQVRRDKAAATIAQAEKYETLAGLLDEYGVETVRELPSDAVLSAGIRGAA